MTYRFRERNQLSNNVYSGTYRRWQKTSCTSAPNWSTLASLSAPEVVGKYESISDVVVPRFHERRLRGEVFFNPYVKTTLTIDPGVYASEIQASQTSFECSSPNSYFPIASYTNIGPFYGGLGSLVPLSSRSIASRITSDLLSPLLTEVSTSVMNKRGRSDSNLYESLAEANKLLGLLPSLLGNAAKVISAKKGLMHRARSAGSAYLAYRYGLQPVMSDVESVVKGINKKLGNVRETKRASASATQAFAWSRNDPGLGAIMDTRSDFTQVEEISARAMSLDEFSATLSSNIGFTSKGLITLPWELLPYSFVVDWFVNIGDFIGSLVPALGYTQLGSCITVKHSIKLSQTVSTTGPASGYTVLMPAIGSKTASFVTTTRTVGLASPGVVIKSDFKLDNITRSLDAISLVVQKLKTS